MKSSGCSLKMVSEVLLKVCEVIWPRLYMCVAPGLTSSLRSLFWLPLTITDVSLAGAQVSMFQIPGIFHKLMLQPMTYLKCKRELKFALSRSNRVVGNVINGNKYKEGIMDCGKNMFMSIIFYWKSFILDKILRKI